MWKPIDLTTVCSFRRGSMSSREERYEVAAAVVEHRCRKPQRLIGGMDFAVRDNGGGRTAREYCPATPIMCVRTGPMGLTLNLNPRSAPDTASWFRTQDPCKGPTS